MNFFFKVIISMISVNLLVTIGNQSLISGADFWQSYYCGFNDKKVKTSKNVALDLLNKKGYGPSA